jgi:hypothetical protein
MAKKGLHELGIEAFDSQGRFKGLQYVIGQLGDAQKHMTSQQFTAASAMAFGKPALAAMVALAHQGSDAFQQFGCRSTASVVPRLWPRRSPRASAARCAALGKQISAAFLQVYLGVSPRPGEGHRGFSSKVSEAIPYIKRGIRPQATCGTSTGPPSRASCPPPGRQSRRRPWRGFPPLRRGW